MSKHLIECPECEHKFSLADSLRSEIETEIGSSLAAKHSKEISKKEVEIDRMLESFEKEKKALEKKQANFDKALKEKLELETPNLEKKLRKKISEESKSEISELESVVEEKSKLLLKAQKGEIELRKLARELEDKDKARELEFQKKVDAERVAIGEAATKLAVEEYRLKDAQRDKRESDMLKQIEDLKRKAEQGSQQAQGEILELEIESALKSFFITDQIEPVAKGIKGGDIIQKVISPFGMHAGTIVWETKRTKAWSDSWIEKLKEDQRRISAEFGVIVTQTMPKGMNHLGQIDGIWIVDFNTFQGIAIALRSNILQLFQARNAAVGKGEKMDFLYNYLTGTQFKQRVEGIVETFRSMQVDLDSEKRVTQKNWASREQRIAKVVLTTAGMYGDVEGIIGASLPKIAALEYEGEDTDKSTSESKGIIL